MVCIVYLSLHLALFLALTVRDATMPPMSSSVLLA